MELPARDLPARPRCPGVGIRGRVRDAVGEAAYGQYSSLRLCYGIMERLVADLDFSVRSHRILYLDSPRHTVESDVVCWVSFRFLFCCFLFLSFPLLSHARWKSAS